MTYMIVSGQSNNGHLILKRLRIGKFFVHKAKHLSGLNLALVAWKIPGEPLAFGACWELKEARF